MARRKRFSNEQVIYKLHKGGSIDSNLCGIAVRSQVKSCFGVPPKRTAEKGKRDV